ncbi:NAD(P)H-dependent flavin oxidoreductase [Chloroflexota bacterium]
MIKSRVCDLLGIRYPVIQGVVGAKHIQIAAAVSQAGGLGVIHGMSAAQTPEGENRKDRIRSCIREMRQLTSNPFSINIVVRRPTADDLVNTAIEEGMKVVVTSSGDPGKYTPRLKEANIRVLHVLANTDQAMKAAEAGVDVVIAAGVEAGGWQSRDEVTTFCLIPQVVDALEGRIPVVAAGGIGDSRGVVAAFSLGAEGVQMGTRFLASIEASLDKGWGEAILRARDTSTEITGRGESPARNFKIDFLQEVRPGFNRPKAGPGGGAGQVSGMINEIMSVEDIIKQLTEGVGEVLDKLNKSFAL